LLLLTMMFAATLAHGGSGSAGAQEVSFSNRQGVELSGWLYVPTGPGLKPAVVMLHGCSGIHAGSDPKRRVARLYREWSARLIASGYVVLLVDSFGPRHSAQKQCGNGPAGVSEVTDRPEDAHAARRFLQSGRFPVDPARIMLLGWSHGGSSVIAALIEPAQRWGEGHPFRGGIAFYPGCGFYNGFGGIATSRYVPHAPMLILHGDADALYRSGHCEVLASRANAENAPNAENVANAAHVANAKNAPSAAHVASAANATADRADRMVEVIVYAGASHGFANARERNGSFGPADREARKRAASTVMRRLAKLSR
jgi:dienelactone hydrolase